MWLESKPLPKCTWVQYIFMSMTIAQHPSSLYWNRHIAVFAVWPSLPMQICTNQCHIILGVCLQLWPLIRTCEVAVNLRKIQMRSSVYSNQLSERTVHRKRRTQWGYCLNWEVRMTQKKPHGKCVYMVLSLCACVLTTDRLQGALLDPAASCWSSSRFSWSPLEAPHWLVPGYLGNGRQGGLSAHFSKW